MEERKDGAMEDDEVTQYFNIPFFQYYKKIEKGGVSSG
jgi:hypothetical protein